jgi:hypothetical protein
LNDLLKGLSALDPVYEKVLVSPADLVTVVKQTAASVRKKVSRVGEVLPGQRPKAIRVILCAAGEDDSLSKQLEGWLQSARPKLLEPVTSALVLGGLLFALSTSVEIEYENQKLKVKVKKPGISEKVLEKFFGFFK